MSHQPNFNGTNGAATHLPPWSAPSSAPSTPQPTNLVPAVFAPTANHSQQQSLQPQLYPLLHPLQNQAQSSSSALPQGPASNPMMAPMQPMPNMQNMQGMIPNMQNMSMPPSMLAMMNAFYAHNQLFNPNFSQPGPSIPFDATSPALQSEYDQLVARALIDGKKAGLRRVQAFDTLHNKYARSTAVWKDYYIEYAARIERLATTLENPGLSAVTQGVNGHRIASSSAKPSVSNETKPSISTSSSARSVPKATNENRVSSRAASTNGRKEKSPPTSRSRSTSVVLKRDRRGRRKRSAQANTAGVTATKQKSPLKRSTNNSLSILGAAAKRDLSYYVRPPSRTPSPPPNSREAHKNVRNAFTKEDEDFFFKFLSWHLVGKDANLTKGELCELLGEKAPGHPAQSWLGFWRKNEDIADKLFTYAKYDEEDRQVFLQNMTGKAGPVATASSARNAPNYAEETTSGSDMDAEGETDIDEESSLSEAEDDEPQPKEEIYTDDHFPRLSEDEANLGGIGSSYTIVEERVLARYIVNFAKSHNLSSVYQWDHHLTAEERWVDFVKKYPQRTKAAWREFFRKDKDTIFAIAKRMQLKEERRSSLKTQRGRPSWASSREGKPDSSDAENKRRRVER